MEEGAGTWLAPSVSSRQRHIQLAKADGLAFAPSRHIIPGTMHIGTLYTFLNGFRQINIYVRVSFSHNDQYLHGKPTNIGHLDFFTDVLA